MKPEYILQITFIIFFIYFLVLNILYLFSSVAGLFQSRRRAFQSKEESPGVIFSTHFFLPVSIIIPARNEKKFITDSLKSVLTLDYPEFEIIVVNDGSTDRTLKNLDDILSLKQFDKAYTDRFDSSKIHEVYKSIKYPYVTVISTTGGLKKAGAVNAALNFVRYKYICVIDADTIIEPDALIKVMIQVEKDPDKIIGIGSYFGLANGFKIKDGKILEKSFSFNPLIAYQNLEYMRSFMGSRLLWSAFNAMPCISGGFAVWRRDIVTQLGGFETELSSEDIELTFHAHDYMIKNNKEHEVLVLPYYVGWTEGPTTIPSLILQRNRWQRVTNETIWRYKHMLFNPRYKWLGFFTVPYFLFYEVFGVLIEVASIAVFTWAWAIKLLDVRTYLAYLLFMVLVQAFISLIVIFTFVRDQKIMRFRYTCYFILLSFLELFLYKWITTVAKLLGTLDYCRGIRVMGQYKRK